MESRDGGWGCNKAENEERQKRNGAGGGQARHRLRRCLLRGLGQVAAPDNLAAQSSILSGGDKGFLHPSSPSLRSAPLPPILGFSQAGRFDVAGSCGPLGHATAGIRLERGSISGALRCLALSGLIKALRQG